MIDALSYFVLGLWTGVMGMVWLQAWKERRTWERDREQP